MKEQRYSAQIQSVNRALDLFRSRQESQAANKFKKITSNVDDSIVLHCCSSKLHNSRSRKRQKVMLSGFSRNLVAIEMRKCLMRHDWPHLVELLPLLLAGRLEIEPLIWRYLITQLFYDPKGSLAILNHFVERCVGTDNIEGLKKVLTLSSQIEESDSA